MTSDYPLPIIGLGHPEPLSDTMSHISKAGGVVILGEGGFRITHVAKTHAITCVNVTAFVCIPICESRRHQNYQYFLQRSEDEKTNFRSSFDGGDKSSCH